MIFYEQFVGEFDTPQKFEAGQNLYFEVHVQIALFLSILEGFQQMMSPNLS